MKQFEQTLQWISNDFKSNSFRFSVEVIAWAASIGCSIVMAFTVPTPPLLELYVVWITGCIMYAWAAWSRNSFGMLINYIALVMIDSIALYRIIYS
tara:strand:- start:63 stop:350 length:288 start_codon:yes stop_codon:yes gene_type:complete